MFTVLPTFLAKIRKGEQYWSHRHISDVTEIWLERSSFLYCLPFSAFPFSTQSIEASTITLGCKSESKVMPIVGLKLPSNFLEFWSLYNQSSNVNCRRTLIESWLSRMFDYLYQVSSVYKSIHQWSLDNQSSNVNCRRTLIESRLSRMFDWLYQISSVDKSIF